MSNATSLLSGGRKIAGRESIGFLRGYPGRGRGRKPPITRRPWGGVHSPAELQAAQRTRTGRTKQGQVEAVRRLRRT